MPAQTARLALPYPIPDDTVDVPRDVQALAVKLDAITPTYVQGASFAARPAAGVAGRMYVATDAAGGAWYDTGATWVTLAPSYVNALPTANLVDDDEFDLWVTAAGGVWRCKYDSSQAPYPWLVVGGPLIIGRADAMRAVTGAAYVALPTDPMTVTLPTEGIYDVTVEASVWSNANSLVNAALSYTVGATAANDAWSAQAGFVAQISSVSCTTRQTLPGPSLTLVERARASATAGHSGNIGNRRIIAAPVRIAA
jgi:hypothetical protein